VESAGDQESMEGDAGPNLHSTYLYAPTDCMNRTKKCNSIDL
jgi:hypothetical protein